MASSSLGIFLAVTFAIIALGLISFGFATDYWIQYTVDTDKLISRGYEKEVQTIEHWNTRHRGLFRECYYNKSRKFLSSDAVDASCKYLEFEIPESDNFVQRSQNYITFIHLRRCNIAFLITCMLILVICIIVGGFGCWKSQRALTRTAGILTLIAVFFGVCGMAFFHGAKVMEDDKVTEIDLPWLRTNWIPYLEQHTKMTFRWSYILTWVGIGIGILSAVLFLLTCWISHQKEKDNMKLLNERYSSRSRAYEYFDFPTFTSEKGSVRGGYMGPDEMYDNRSHSVPPPPPHHGENYGDGTWRWESNSQRY